MNILHISNFYYDRGGDCTHLLSSMKLLERKGHKNIIFSMKHPKNFPSAYSKYFISYINYVDELSNRKLLSGFKILFRAIYSIEAKIKMKSLIESEKPDIAHIQSIHHHITHSILYPLKEKNIPVVWTLHDYALICPNTRFLCREQVCESCKSTRYYAAILKRCKKNSLGASTVATLETIVHKIMNIYELIDVFITPSKFLKDKLIEYGFDEHKIVCLNNFIDVIPDAQRKATGDYYVYLGRISEEKGVKTLIDAALKVNSGFLKIVGDGPLKEELSSYVHMKNGGGKIMFLGHKSHEEVMDLLKNCKFMVIPSEWYENYPYAVIEAFACGKPVIGARIGGIPELVKDKETGLTFEPKNAEDLSLKIKYILDNADEAETWGGNARRFVKQELNGDRYYDKLMEIYNTMITRGKSCKWN